MVELLDLEEQVQETLVDLVDLLHPIMDGAMMVEVLMHLTLVDMVVAVAVPVEVETVVLLDKVDQV